MPSGYRVIEFKRVLQLPVITDIPEPYTGNLHWKTGILCPSCCMKEIVYNGNYFCSGLDEDRKWCQWALPHYDPDPANPKYDEPRPMWNLVDALVKAGTLAVKKTDSAN